MRNVFTAILLLLLAWQTIELAVRCLVWEQKAPEAPLWACALLIALNMAVLALSLARIFGERRRGVM